MGLQKLNVGPKLFPDTVCASTRTRRKQEDDGDESKAIGLNKTLRLLLTIVSSLWRQP